jgi:hypothetical protein
MLRRGQRGDLVGCPRVSFLLSGHQEARTLLFPVPRLLHTPHRLRQVKPRPPRDATNTTTPTSLA